MPIAIRNEKTFQILEVSGLASADDKKKWEEAGSQWLKTKDELSLLVLLKDFKGWAKGPWGDLSFMMNNDQKMRKIAFVGDATWKDEMNAFTGAGMRHCKVEFFAAEPDARRWLAS